MSAPPYVSASAAVPFQNVQVGGRQDQRQGSRQDQRQDRQPQQSRLWYSDREIKGEQPASGLIYTSEDFRRELKRVERRLYALAIISIIAAIAAVAAIIGVFLQIGWGMI